MSRFFYSCLGAAMFASVASAADTETKPEFAFSAAGTREGRIVNGPLYKRVEADFKKVAKGGQVELDKLTVKNASLKYYPDLSKGPSSKAQFTAATVKAMLTSCIGPYPYDERASWVQLSWVCPVRSETSFSKVATFRDSPEMSVTVWFDDGRIKEILGMEPLPVPGAKRFVMGAADQVAGSR